MSSISGSNQPMLVSFCDTCFREPATLTCHQCKIDCCFLCSHKRHKLGRLITHTFSILPYSRNSITRRNAPTVCDWCQLHHPTIYCPPCDIHFCLHGCADAFHEQTRDTATHNIWQQHKMMWKYGDGEEEEEKLIDRSLSVTPNRSPHPSPHSLPHPHTRSAPGSIFMPISRSTSPSSSPNKRPSDTSSQPTTPKPLSSRPTIPPLIFSAPTTPHTQHTSPSVHIHTATPSHSYGDGDGDGDETGRDRMGTVQLPRQRSELTISTHATSTPRRASNPGPSSARGPGPSHDKSSIISISSFLNEWPPRKSGGYNPIETFRLSNYSLGYGCVRQKLYDIPQYTISFDHIRHEMNIYSNHENIGWIRHFISIEGVFQDQSDDSHFFLQFSDAKPMARCVAMSSSEGIQIKSVITKIIEEKKEEKIQLQDSDTLYSGRLLKKGKMSYAQRWFVIQRFKLKLYKSKPLTIPSHVIHLVDAKITPRNENKVKIITSKRPYSFKMSSAVEMETFISLVKRAREPVKYTIPISISSDSSRPLPGSSPQHPSASSTQPSIPPLPLSPPPAHLMHPPTPPPPPPASLSFIHNYQSDSDGDDDETSPRSPLHIPAFIITPDPEIHVSFDDNHQHSHQHISDADIDGEHTPIPAKKKLNLTISTSSPPAWSPPVSPTGGLLSPLHDPKHEIRHQRRQSRRTISRDFHMILEKNKSQVSTRLILDDTEESGAERIEFQEFALDVTPYDHPHPSVYIGCYPVMQSLYDTMKSGGRVSESIFVPKVVWFQQNAKFQAFIAKMENLEVLRFAIAAAQSVPRGTLTALEKCFSSFRLVMEDVQDKLAQHLSFIHSVKQPLRTQHKDNHSTMARMKRGLKTFGKVMSRATTVTGKVEDTTNYVRLLRTVLKQAQFFNQWGTYSDLPVDDIHDKNHPNATILREQINQHLIKISEFWYAVVCNFALRDLQVVLKRYVKHCTRTLTSS